MKKTVIALVSAVACVGMAFAAGEDNLTLAAQDTSKIPELVKSLDGQKGSDFAADVISAIAAKPGNPSKKVKEMAAASEAFLGSVPDGELASLIANLVANVPFGSLPAWVDSFKGAVDDFTKDLSDEAYNKLVNDVMAKINRLGDTSDADKTVISSFALKLLARGSTPEEKTDWLKGIALPSSYGKQVTDAAPSVFAGNYDAVLGPDIVIVKSNDVYIVEPGDDVTLVEEAVKTGTSPIGISAVDEATDREGIERPEPLGAPVGTGSAVSSTSKSKSKSTPSKSIPTPSPKPPKPPKPPVPPPYDGQF